MKKIPKSKVTKISIARLYNTGNYEHVRFEITADVAKGGSAKQTFLELGALIARLRPVKVPYEYGHAKEVISKLPEALNEGEKARLTEYQEMVKEIESARALRLQALDKLDYLGGGSKHTDAKLNWDEEPPF